MPGLVDEFSESSRDQPGQCWAVPGPATLKTGTVRGTERKLSNKNAELRTGTRVQAQAITEQDFMAISGSALLFVITA